MQKRKFILVVFVIAIIAIQFIRPARNVSGQAPGIIFIDSFQVNDTISRLLATSCFDCHSNTTRYPWYTYVQPVGWFMASHIRKGKAKLNFDELPSFGPRKQRSKFREMEDQIVQDKMPLASYTLMHPEARLTAVQKNMLLAWIRKYTDN